MNIWGFGSIKDEKLNALIEAGRMRFEVPDNIDQAFNIFVLHQNRTKRGSSEKSYFQEKYIPEFIDLVLWGHEHDNRLSLEYCPTPDCFITQPGSTVPTSLSEGESDDKCIALLTITKPEDQSVKFKFDPIPLQTTRRVIFKNVYLEDLNVTKEEIKNKSKGLQIFKTAIKQELELLLAEHSKVHISRVV